MIQKKNLRILAFQADRNSSFINSGNCYRKWMNIGSFLISNFIRHSTLFIKKNRKENRQFFLLKFLKIVRLNWNYDSRRPDGTGFSFKEKTGRLEKHRKLVLFELRSSMSFTLCAHAGKFKQARLKNLEPLSFQSYLTKGGYESEINSRSKTSGKVAKYAAQLFEDLLSGSTGNPTLVKGAVSKASGLFRGTAQEDAQEFLRWFLEGKTC